MNQNIPAEQPIFSHPTKTIFFEDNILI
jgi:hypothetical protein